tara:strand:- start:3607 stop:3981 length:375 start_codon:yes stop_codon:yes gene_type:complete
MRLDQLYQFISANISTKVFPIVVPVDFTDDAIIYNLESVQYEDSFDGETNFYQARVNFVSVSKTALSAIGTSQTLEDLLTDFSGFLVAGGQYVQDTQMIDKATVFDPTADCFGVSLTVEFYYNN